MKRCYLLNIFKHICVVDKNLKVSGLAFVKISDTKKILFNKFTANVNGFSYPIYFLLKRGIFFIKNYRINYYKFLIPIDELLSFDIQNKIVLNYNEEYSGRIIYNVFDLKKGKNRNSKIIKNKDKSIYLRQTIKNTMYITVRDTNCYDSFWGKLKISIGYLLSKITFQNKSILLFEKESSRYEESASVLYESLIDKGYKNVYYIINKDNEKISSLKEEYRRNLIYKDSFKHIIYFFKSNKFIGTESLGHAMHLRIANRRVLKKLNSKKIMYVFLQHGVMYMISLSSDLRTGFKKQPYKLHKIVVSSRLEARHFIEMANFSIDDLYICGLPKFDTAIKYNNADKIVIMPTWRRWEVNQAYVNYEKTKYFQMIKRIVSVIPKKWEDKVVILPHPLMLKSIKNNPQFERYLPNAPFSYDEILRNCKLLITDYSSISYDAFYRGSNVIFYWEEKEECLEKYGKSAKLMLTSRKAFGDICYNKNDLKNILTKNYEEGQQKKYIERFRRIVSFHDNRNTERLIEMLQKDGVI